MKISLKHVGAIDEGKIEVKEKSVNIKYGINGIGKSTISKAIVKKAYSENMDDLVTYGKNENPIVEMDIIPENVLVFNQEYIRNYLFKEDLLNNTFEIVINTPEYKVGLARINSLFIDLTNTIANSSIEIIKKEMGDFIKSVDFKSSKKKGLEIKGTCKLAKGKKVPNMSSSLSEKSKKYIEDLSDENNYEWIKWFNSGIEMISRRKLDECPLCKGSLKDNNLKLIADEINSIVNSTSLKNNMEIKDVVEKIAKFIDEDTAKNMKESLKEGNEFTSENVSSYKESYDLINDELQKLNRLSTLNVIKIKDMFENGTMVDFFEKNLLRIELYSHLDEETFERIKKINSVINQSIQKNDELESLASEFALNLYSTIEGKTKYVNEFLEIAGIPYIISIEPVLDDNYKTVLKPKNEDRIITDDSLSYGERNAVSLLLFSLEAEKYDMIILDDPVSSFDNNKKFALLYYLFSKENAIFDGKTIILFTHDFELVIDFTYKHEFRKIDKVCHHITNRNGKLEEQIIVEKKIKHTVKQWKTKAKNSQLNKLLRIVNLRKYMEYIDTDKKIELEILSSLEHRYSQPMVKENKEFKPILKKEVEKASEYIRENYIENFDYDVYLSEIDANVNLKKWYFSTSADIDKLQIMRIYLDKNKDLEIDNRAFMGFITESYHVENNVLKTLDEKRFNVIPQYIMQICDGIMEK